MTKEDKMCTLANLNEFYLGFTDGSSCLAQQKHKHTQNKTKYPSKHYTKLSSIIEFPNASKPILDIRPAQSEGTYTIPSLIRLVPGGYQLFDIKKSVDFSEEQPLHKIKIIKFLDLN